MIAQLELGATPGRELVPAARTPEASEVDTFCHWLTGRAWVTAGDIARVTMTERWTDERHLRLLAKHSGGRVISGQKGYRLTREATDDECDRAENWLRSQAREMDQRAIEIRKCRNGVPTTATATS